MKKLTFISFFTLFIITAFAQIHRTEISSPLNYEENSLDLTCKPCQGQNLLISKVEGTAASNTDDYLSLDLYQGSTITTTKAFPDQLSVNEYSIYEDAVVKRILDSAETVCEGYLVSFTAKTNQTYLPGTSYFFETHVIRFDANLNRIWHRILFNNVGFSTFAVDMEVDHANREAVVLMRKNGNSTLLAEVDLVSGTTNTAREYTISSGGTNLSARPQDIISLNWPAAPSYAIAGNAGGQVSLMLIDHLLAPNRFMTYDVDGDGEEDETGVSLAIHDGDLFMTGLVYEGNPTYPVSYTYLMRLQRQGSPTAIGNIIWTKKYGIPTNGSRVSDMATAEDGSGILLTGKSNIIEGGFPIGDSGTPFISKIDANGNVLWAQQYHDGPNDQGALTDIDVSGTTICACGTTWSDPSAYDYDLLNLATDASGVINAVCDSSIQVDIQNLSSLRSSASSSVVNRTAIDYDVITGYSGAAWNVDSCVGNNPSEITGIKWIDVNCDGVLNGSETPTQGWTIELRDAAGNLLQSAITDASGQYSFDVYITGNYYITEVNEPCYDQETPASNAPYYLYVPGGTQLSGYDFGNCPCDDIIGYDPIPDWYDPKPTPGFYSLEILEYDGHILASDFINRDIALWDDVTESWSVVYTHTDAFKDMQVYDGKLFISGSSPVWFNSSIYSGSPVPNSILAGSGLTVNDYEIMGGNLYAAGQNGTSSNIWVTGPGTPGFTASTTPFNPTYPIDEIGAHNSELVVIGPFGTAPGNTSQNILLFDPGTSGGISSLGTVGLQNYLGSNFENHPDIISLNNQIHVSGRFQEISDASSTNIVPGTRGYAIYDDNPGSPTYQTWLPNTGTSSGNPWDMEEYMGHIYIVGFFNDIAGTTHDRGVVYDGSTYHPLQNSYFGNVVYATNMVPSGKDKLICAFEFAIEFAVCGGDNCAAYLSDTTLCPAEPHVFQPFLSFPSGSYEWDFGDGNTSTQRNPSHSYIIPGSYTVTLDYDDGNGCTGTVTATVDVIDRPDCDFVSEPTDWEKLYGDSQNNKPVKIKRTPFNEILVLGNIHDLGPNGEKSGTLSKFDAATGSLIWHFRTIDPVEFRDIEYNLTTREYLITGLSLPFQGGGIFYDNQSVIIKVTDNGTTYNATSSFNSYSQLGREYFEEITRNEYPAAGANGHDFYFTGARNYAGSTPPPPTHIDQHVVGNMDINRGTGAGSWYEYTTVVGDDEYQRGLFSLPSHDIVCVGTTYPGGNNYGYILELDPVTGGYKNDMVLQDIIDLFHGISYRSINSGADELYIVVGNHFGSGEALIALIDNSNNTVLDAVRVPELQNFEEVFKDAYGNFYVVGQSKDVNQNGRNVVVKFEVIENPPSTPFELSLIWSKYLEDGESQYETAHIYVDERSDHIYYVDGRHDNSAGYLLSDMLVMVTDLEMTSSDCIEDTTLSFNHITIPTAAGNPTISSTPLPSPFSQHVYNDLDYLCNDICVPPCVLDWNWIQDDCYGVQFTAITDSSLTAPLQIDWDIYNDNTIDYNTANPNHDFMTGGVYDVCLTVSDAAGVLCGTVCKTITVGPDTQIPTITCPPNQYHSIESCDRGKIVYFNPPIATDCDDSLSVNCSHQSGDFFPCGVTTVTCSATDQEGNTVTCSFLVVVNCTCISMTAAALECTDQPDTYAFNIDVNDLTGSGNNCTAPILSANQSGVTLTVLSQTQTAAGWNVMGTLYAPVCPAINAFALSAQMTCVCPDGLPVSCSSSISIPAICCDSIYIDSLKVCQDSFNIDISASFFGMVKDIDQMNWYVMKADTCPDTLWNDVPFQTSYGYRDLRISPGLYGGKICYQAEVLLGGDEGPCDRLISTVECIDLCSPPSCNMTATQEFCYSGFPIQPDSINLSLDIPECDYTIEWYVLRNGNRVLLPNTNQMSYLPAPMSISDPDACDVSRTYEVELTGPCGPVTCQSSIVLYNEAVSLGSLDVISMDSIPLCYGEDILLEYSPNCIDSDESWTWFSKNISQPIYTPVPGAGTRNTLVNSNPLYENTMYKIEAQNGVCPVQEITLNVPVKNTIQIGSLQASFLDSCRSSGVNFSIDIPSCTSGGALCDCFYEVNWYRNGVKIFGKNYTVAPATFQYIDPTLDGDYSGNYQVIIKDHCCDDSLRSNVVRLLPPPELIIAGNCYTCDTLSPQTLYSSILYPLPGTISYQWYRVLAGTDVPIPGETGPTLTTTDAGLFKLVAKWPNSCTIEALHLINDCSRNSPALFAMSLQGGSFRFMTPNRGLQMKTPDGTTMAIVVDEQGLLQTVPCFPMDPAMLSQSTQIESHDVLVENPVYGVVFDHLDQTGNTASSILTVDNEGTLWYKAMTISPGQDIEIESGIMDFESPSTGVILTSPNGKHWRIAIDIEGNIVTESIKN